MGKILPSLAVSCMQGTANVPLGTEPANWGNAMRTGLALLISTLGLLQVSVALADTEECQDALDQYKTAASDVSDQLRRYGSCISDSRGHDDCSSEFSGLRSAQDDFETAVSAYESDCQ